MFNAFKTLLSSKKFWALITGMLSLYLVMLFGFDESYAMEIATRITAMVSAYILAQGVADHGKEKAKIEAAKK